MTPSHLLKSKVWGLIPCLYVCVCKIKKKRLLKIGFVFGYEIVLGHSSINSIIDLKFIIFI